MNHHRPQLCRSRKGWIFGVCRGLADYADIPVFWIRLLAFVIAVMSGFWPILIMYLVAAIFMKPASAIELRSDEDWDLHCSYTADRGRAVNQLKRKFDRLDRRTRRIESIVTDREFDWERRFESRA